MNIPNVYRKAVDGFVIPPRSFFQMFLSAAQGTFALFDESNRSDFIANLDKGTINEGVISQATAGPMIMLSLFHDLQNPLFKQTKFDVGEFLEGVGPALENFHNISGALENQLQTIISEDDKIDEEGKNTPEEDSKSEKEAVDETMSALGMPTLGALFPQGAGSGVSKILKHDWMDDAKADPDSLAGQLSRMVSKELFQIHQVSSKTQFLLQNHARNVKFQEGSCLVNNVALLSARAFLCREKEAEVGVEAPGPTQYETFELDAEDGGSEEKGVGVAAQMEVLYDVTQEFTVEKARTSIEAEGDETAEDVGTETLQTTIVSVATLEGWLQRGPEGELRWRLALYRPAFEFPGIQQAY